MQRSCGDPGATEGTDTMSGDRWVDVGARDAAIRDAKRGCDCPRCEAIRFTKQQGDFAVAVEHDLRRRAEDQLADAQRTAAQAVARVRELEGELGYAREHALPLPLTPWAGPATGNDMVDRLRGIYVMPVIGERRFGASAINLEAAARLEVTERDRADAAGLLTDCADMLAQAEEIIRDDQSDDELDDDEEGYLPLIGKVRNLVARLTASAAGREADRG